MQSSKLWVTTVGKKKACDLIAALLTVILLVVIFRSYTAFVFSTNDDLFIKSIVSGEVTGRPEFRCIYLGILSGIVICRFYMLFPTIPWYGIFLCACLCTAMFVVLFRCLQSAGKIVSKLVVLILFCLISGSLLFQHFALIQFTVVAAIVGAASIFSFFTIDDKKTGPDFIIANIPSFLLFLLAVSIRDKAAYMLLPIAGMLWLFKWLNGKDPFKKKRLIGYLGYMLMILVLLLAVKLVDKAAYTGDDWKEFWAYTDANSQIVDYTGYPDYEKHQELYDRYGITNESYQGASERYLLLLDDKLNAKSMEALAAAAQEDRDAEYSLSEKIVKLIRDFVERNLIYIDRPINLFVYAAYLLITVLALIHKKYRVLVLECLLLTGRMVSWLYLIWQGRYPERVTQGLYFAELLALLAIIITNKLLIMKKKAGLVICVGLFCLLSLYFGTQKAGKVKGAIQGRLYSSTAYTQLKNYCTSHPENLYLLDMRSVEYYSEDILHKQEYRELNFVVLGSWIPKSPLYTNKMEKWGINDLEQSILNSEHIFFVCKDEEGLEPDYIYNYFKTKYPSSDFRIADKWKADNGDTFLMIQLQQ